MSFSALETAVACEQTKPSPSRQEYKKRFVDVFARELLPECRVNIQIALKFNFFLKFQRFSKIPPKFRNYVAKPTVIKLQFLLSVMGGELLFPYCKFSLTFNRSVGNQELHT